MECNEYNSAMGSQSKKLPRSYVHDYIYHANQQQKELDVNVSDTLCYLDTIYFYWWVMIADF